MDKYHQVSPQPPLHPSKISMDWLQIAEANSISFCATKLLLFREVLRAGVNPKQFKEKSPFEADTPHPRQVCANAAQPTFPGTSKMLRAQPAHRDET